MVDARSATSVTAKTTLAEQVLGLADEERAVATQYALLQGALQLAIESGAVDIVDKAIEKLATPYEVDDRELQTVAYAKIAAEAPVENSKRSSMNC